MGVAQTAQKNLRLFHTYKYKAKIMFFYFSFLRIPCLKEWQICISVGFLIQPVKRR